MHGFFSNHQLLEGDFNLQELQVIEQIGKGNACVYTAFVRGQYRAMKEIQIKGDYQYRNFLKEISLMQELSANTSSIIKYEGYLLTQLQLNQYTRKKFAFIIMQCAKMNLHDLIKYQQEQGKKFYQKQCQDILEFLIKSFCQLQRLSVAHCDIKPENILIMNTEKLQLKLCDAGSCKIINAESIEEATIYGTVPFLAPQLIKAKQKKIMSNNAFKSDVFSFGLVYLYVVTGKKFTSKERAEISQQTYMQIINEWIEQAIESTNNDPKVSQVLRNALVLDEYQRPLFKNLKIIFDSFKRKLKLTQESKRRKLSAQQQNTMEYINKFNNQISQVQLNTARTTLNYLKKPKKLNRINRFNTKISTNNINKSRYKTKNSPNSSLKSNTSFVSSNSPDKISPTVFNVSKIIHITNQNKEVIPYDFFNHEDKIFVLHANSVHFKKTDIVSIFQSCPLSVLYPLSQVSGNKLYLQYKGVDGIGLAQDAPILDFKEVYINLQNTKLVGGYNQLLRSLCPISLQKLRLRISGSQIIFKEVKNLVDRLKNRSIKQLSLIWQRNELESFEHTQIIQRISKLGLRKLTLSFNECYIKYNSGNRWPIPKTVQILYLQYQHNFMGAILQNLCITLSELKLKWLYLNFENNNIEKTEINAIINAIVKIQTLQKFIFNFSMNNIQDIQYLSQTLLKGKRIKYLQMSMHKCGITFQKFCAFLETLSVLFNEGEQVMKFTIDRKIAKGELQETVKQCFKNVNNVKINVLGYDTKYYFINIKREQKIKIVNTNSILVRRQKTNHLLIKVNKIRKIEKQSYKNKDGICHFRFSNYESYESYLCLKCCEEKQMSKYLYYCKYCIESCEHKGHNILRVFDKRPCSCAYSSNCVGGQELICSESMNIKYKKQYRCQKCRAKYCQYCIKKCKHYHEGWIQVMNCVNFTCGTKL